MGVFTADLNEIRELIQQGEMSPLDVRIIKAAKAQPIQILNCYPNIEELRCPVLCRDTLKILPTYLSVATKLKNLTVICMVTQDIPDEIIFADENENMTMTEEPPVKKHKGISEVEKITQLEIPYIIEILGNRITYLDLDIIIILDDEIEEFTRIRINEGIYYTNNEKICGTYIFDKLISLKLLKGIVTNGDILYDPKGAEIQNLTILPTNTQYVDNSLYLYKLIERAKNISIPYNSKNFYKRQIYSNLILSSTKGEIKRLNAIVPIDDLLQHVTHNTKLQEIHVLIETNDEKKIIHELFDTFKDRQIFLNIHHNNNLLLSDLLYLGDIKYSDILKTLLENSIY